VQWKRIWQINFLVQDTKMTGHQKEKTNKIYESEKRGREGKDEDRICTAAVSASVVSARSTQPRLAGG
jgi:hypothetical protein